MFRVILLLCVFFCFNESKYCSKVGYNETQCGADATCCRFNWAPDTYGCCPYEDAVCCANHYTCCPSGSTCVDEGSGWAVVTTCKPSMVTGKQICKPGPPKPFNTTMKNCLVLGDSVSIGYTPYVAALLEQQGICSTQHTPWGGDGGAAETAYGVQCLDYFLSSPSGVQLKPDFIMFNFGLHDGPLGNSTIPGQQGVPELYLPQLTNITERLQATGAKLLFALTSPVLCNATRDGCVINLNNQARKLMESKGIPMVDPYSAIINRCGTPPQPECDGHKDCWCPHCPAGYGWLAENVMVPAIKAVLSKS